MVDRWPFVEMDWTEENKFLQCNNWAPLSRACKMFHNLWLVGITEHEEEGELQSNSEVYGHQIAQGIQREHEVILRPHGLGMTTWQRGECSERWWWTSSTRGQFCHHTYQTQPTPALVAPAASAATATGCRVKLGLLLYRISELRLELLIPFTGFSALRFQHTTLFL